MAKIFKIQDPAPAMGDAEAQFLTDNFPVEWESEVDGVQGVRVTQKDLSKFKSEMGAIGPVEKHMVSCLELMLDRKEHVDLLVWW